MRILLTIVAVITGLLSLMSLAWWLAHSYNIVMGQGGLEMLKQTNLGVAIQVEPTKVFLYQVRDYFTVIGGVVGWIALISLYLLARRPLSNIPKWVFFSLAVGVAAAIVMPYGRAYACFPIVAAISLLLRCHLLGLTLRSRGTR